MLRAASMRDVGETRRLIPVVRDPVVGVVLTLTMAGLFVQLWAIEGYGWFRDEFYYLACARRLAWGYVDHPPLSLAMLAGWTRLFGDELIAIRLVPALAGAGTLVLTGLMTRRLGGGTVAVAMAMVCTIASPIYLALHHYYSMNAFDILLWTAAAFVSIGILSVEGPQLRRWSLLGILVGLGLLNKVSMLWFMGGLGLGLLASPARRRLLTPGPWMAFGIAITLFSPHIHWQITHDWPTLEFVRSATQTKMVKVSPLHFVLGQLEATNHANFLMWGAGLGWLVFHPRGKRWRALGYAYVAIFTLLIASGSSRPGYLAPAYTWLFAAGGVMLESVGCERFRRWVVPILLVLVIIVGGVMAPFALPLLPVAQYIAYAKRLHQQPSTGEHKKLAELPQFFADMHGWEAIVDAVARAQARLPEEERTRARVFAGNYGEAGAIEHLGGQRGLPPVISGHNNYWIWGPGPDTEVILVIAREDRSLRALFDEVEVGATIDCGHCMPYENGQTVYIVRGKPDTARRSWNDIKHYD